MTLTQEVLGQRLKEARENVRLTQEVAAEHLGLDRTALIKMEKGTRSVTTIELTGLARLYRRDLTELVSVTPLEEDPFTILGQFAENGARDNVGSVGVMLERLKEAVRLEGFLGRTHKTYPPMYQFDAPGDTDEAIDQGKAAAVLERRRLGLGCAGRLEMAGVITSQGIWPAAVPMSEDASGLFVIHPRYGMAIFVNQDLRSARRRFSIGHEYAHALFDRGRRAELTTAENANSLTEKRANAFASEFLMPAVGFEEILGNIHKGGRTRESTYTYNVFSDLYTHDETRHDALAQRISVTDVALLAHEFCVSYEMAAIRLKDLEYIRKPALDHLLAAKEDAYFLTNALRLVDPDDEEPEPYLVRQLMAFAMEAVRLDRISRGRFVAVCALAGQEPEQLLAIAMRSKEE